MRPAQPLPTSLQRGAFTAAQLRRMGISGERLRRADVVALGSGVYAPASLIESAEARRLYGLRATTLLREYPQAWLSHATAVKLMGGPLPGRLGADPTIHLSVARGQPRPRRAGVRSHEVSEGTKRGISHPRWPGVRISTPVGLFLELAQECSCEELVAIGDWLVREPRYRLERRDEAYSTVEALHRVLLTAGRVRGKRRAREALELVRVGADSPKETAFRLAVIRDGLPEPELQVRLDVLGPVVREADAAYPEYRIAIQYEGARHFTPEQARADQRRDNEFVAVGWLVLRFNVADDREGYASAVQQVRAALLSRGWRP